MTEEVVVVVAGGEQPRADVVLAVPPEATVIAADGGLEHARALGLAVAAVVGDFDSASSDAVAAAEAAGVRVERHPAAKDATDLELALDSALARAPRRVLVLSGVGDRLDHLLSALLLLGSPKWAAVEVDAEIGLARVHVVRGDRALLGRPGELVSLLSLHGPAEGVTTDGLAYPLRGETLDPGSSRGVSNVFSARTAHIRVERGAVLVVRPNASPQEPGEDPE